MAEESSQAVGNSCDCLMCCIDFPAYVFRDNFHGEVGVKGEEQVFECESFLEGEGLGWL